MGGRFALPPRLAFPAAGLLFFYPALLAWYNADDFLHYSAALEGRIPFTAPTDGIGFLRPLTGLTFWLEYRLWGLNPLPPHAFNVLLHLLNSYLVSLLTHKLLLTLPARTSTQKHERIPLDFNTPGPRSAAPRIWPALPISTMAGLLFLVLHCHAEAVMWLSCRGDLLATTSSLTALILCAHAARTGSPLSLSLMVLSLFLALLSKESAVTLPLLLIACLLAASSAQRPIPRLAAGVTAIVGVTLLYFLLRRVTMGDFVAGYGPRGHLRYSADLIAQSLARHGWRLLLPPLPEGLVRALPALEGLWALAFLVALATAALGLAAPWGRFPELRRASLIALALALLPVANVRIGLDHLEGARYLYLPSVFCSVLLAVLLAELRVRPLRLPLFAGLVVFQVFFLVVANLAWKEASDVAQTITRELQRRGDGETILMNKPDALRGALVFRTGLPEAVQYFEDGTGKPPSLSVLYAAGLATPFDNVEAYLSTDGRGMIRPQTPGSTLVEEDRDNLIDSRHDEDGALRFVLREAMEGRTVLYFDGGALTEVPVVSDDSFSR